MPRRQATTGTKAAGSGKAFLESLPKMSETMLALGKPILDVFGPTPTLEQLETGVVLITVACHLPIYEREKRPDAAEHRATFDRAMVTMPRQLRENFARMFYARLAVYGHDPLGVGRVDAGRTRASAPARVAPAVVHTVSFDTAMQESLIVEPIVAPLKELCGVWGLHDDAEAFDYACSRARADAIDRLLLGVVAERGWTLFDEGVVSRVAVEHDGKTRARILVDGLPATPWWNDRIVTKDRVMSWSFESEPELGAGR